MRNSSGRKTRRKRGSSERVRVSQRFPFPVVLLVGWFGTQESGEREREDPFFFC